MIDRNNRDVDTSRFDGENASMCTTMVVIKHNKKMIVEERLVIVAELLMEVSKD